jgi:hypothetical protein
VVILAVLGCPIFIHKFLPFSQRIWETIGIYCDWGWGFHDIKILEVDAPNLKAPVRGCRMNEAVRGCRTTDSER